MSHWNAIGPRDNGERQFTRNVSYFEPWHYVPLLDRKPGALRNGAPFVGWKLPEAMHRTREHYMAGKGGDREFVDLLLLAQDHGLEVVGMACDLAVEQNTLRLPAVINLSLIECCAFDCRPADQSVGGAGHRTIGRSLRLAAADPAPQSRLQAL